MRCRSVPVHAGGGAAARRAPPPAHGTHQKCAPPRRCVGPTQKQTRHGPVAHRQRGDDRGGGASPARRRLGPRGARRAARRGRGAGRPRAPARRVSTAWVGLIVSASTPIPWHCGSHPMASDQICTAVADWVRGPRCAVTHLPGAPVWGRNAPTGAAARPFVGCAVLRCTAVAVTPNVADFCGPLCGLVQRPPVSGRRHSDTAPAGNTPSLHHPSWAVSLPPLISGCRRAAAGQEGSRPEAKVSAATPCEEAWPPSQRGGHWATALFPARTRSPAGAHAELYTVAYLA